MFVDLTDRVLKKTRKSLNTRALIEETYQEHQKAIVGPDALERILNDKLDDMTNHDEGVLHDFQEYCRRNHRQSDDGKENEMTPKEHMDKIDDVIQFVTEWEARRDQAEAMDISSTTESLQTTLLPTGVTTLDVLHYREHMQRLQMREALQRELEKVEQEIAAMQPAQQQMKHAAQEHIDRVEKVEDKLEEAANMCAMVSN
jgi:hypothetical protein